MDSTLSPFRTIAACSVVGLLAIAGISFTQSSEESEVWRANESAKNQMRAAADIEAEKVEQAKAIADTYAKNQIAQIDSLIIQGYTLGSFAPQVDWAHSVDPSRQTRIFDQYRRCIGYAYQGQFFFINTNPTACN